MFRSTGNFVREVVIEMGKVSWPIKRGRNLTPAERFQELKDSTVMVLVSMFVLALYIGVVDIALSSLMSLFIG